MAKTRNTGVQGRWGKEFLKLFKQLTYSRSAWQAWEDLMTAMACSICNVADRREGPFKRREEQYARSVGNLGGVDIPAQIFNTVVMALEENPGQDFLGELYMGLNLGNHWRGQFFTPYHTSRLMAKLTIGREYQDKIGKKGYVSVSDPCAGAGTMLIAAASVFREYGVNYHTSVVFTGQDIDPVAAKMAYIQLSLLGCPGYITSGDSLASPQTGRVLFPQEKEGQELWIMPFFMSDIWEMRRAKELVQGLCGGTVTTEKTVGKEHFYIFFYFDEKEAGKTMETGKQHLPAEETGQNDSAAGAVKKSAGLEKDGTGIKQMAEKKLEKELEKEEKAGSDKAFAEAVTRHLLERCKNDLGLAMDVVQEHKTCKKCFDYIYQQARKQAEGKSTFVHDEVVYEWAEDYYHKDDKAEEEKKAKEKAEKKKAKTKKKTASKKPALNNRKEAEEKQQKLKRNSKDMEGQLDMFSMMGI